MINSFFLCKKEFVLRFDFFLRFGSSVRLIRFSFIRRSNYFDVSEERLIHPAIKDVEPLKKSSIYIHSTQIHYFLFKFHFTLHIQRAISFPVETNSTNEFVASFQSLNGYLFSVLQITWKKTMFMIIYW